jgi:hypothetical protein
MNPARARMMHHDHDDHPSRMAQRASPVVIPAHRAGHHDDNNDFDRMARGRVAALRARVPGRAPAVTR